MFTRPPFALSAAILAGLALALALTIAPADFWWERVDPIGASFSRLATASVFYVGVHDVEGQVAREVRAWRTLAADSAADSLFAALLKHGSPAGRVYAVLGLQHVGSHRLDSVAPLLAGDTAYVDLAVPCRPYLKDARVREVLSLPEASAWRRFLESWTPDADSAFGCVPPN